MGNLNIKNTRRTLQALILLLYFIGISSFPKEFVHLQLTISVFPIYISEITLGFLLLLSGFYWIRHRSVGFKIRTEHVLLAIYFFGGFLFLLDGFRRGYFLSAIRDFALVYYLVFYFVLLQFFLDQGSFTLILDGICIGSLIGSSNSIIHFLSNPFLRYGHASSSYLALYAWISILYLSYRLLDEKRRLVRFMSLIGIVLFLVTIYLSAYRTMLPIMAGCIALILFLLVIFRKRISWTGQRSLLIIPVLALIVLLSGVFTHSLLGTIPGEPLPSVGEVGLDDGLIALSTRWSRVFLKNVGEVEYVDDAERAVPEGSSMDGIVAENSYNFRLQAWEAAARRIIANPILGIGYGQPANLHDEAFCAEVVGVSNCGNAHNTFLTLMMRMGIPMFIVFTSIIGMIVWRLIQSSIRGAKFGEDMGSSILVLVILFSMVVYGIMSLFFESPYLSPSYWGVLAMMSFLSNGASSRMTSHQ